MAEPEIQEVWCSSNFAGNKEDHEHKRACIYVVPTACQHFISILSFPIKQPQKAGTRNPVFLNKGDRKAQTAWATYTRQGYASETEKVEIPIQRCLALHSPSLFHALGLNELVINTSPGVAGVKYQSWSLTFGGPSSGRGSNGLQTSKPKETQMCGLKEVFDIVNDDDKAKSSARVKKRLKKKVCFFGHTTSKRWDWIQKKPT